MGIQKKPAILHPAMKARRVRRFLLNTQERICSARKPIHGMRRDAEGADIDRPDFALLDLLTLALDLADDRDLQIQVAYARTSLILYLTR